MHQVTKIEGVFSGTLSYIFNNYSPATPSSNPSTFASIVTIAREKGYTEPHPGDDLSGTDVARKLTILSRLVPSLFDKLDRGYASVATSSLIPEPLQSIDTGDEFVRRLPEFDAEFEKMRKEAEGNGEVIRYVGVIDVAAGKIEAKLERYVASCTLSLVHRADEECSFPGIPQRILSLRRCRAQTTSSCSTPSVTQIVL